VDGYPSHEEHGIQKAAVSYVGEGFGEVLALYLKCLRARADGESVRELELVCTCFKTWVQRYIDDERGAAKWMNAVTIFLSGVARYTATQLDQAKKAEGNTDDYVKKLLDIHRDLFKALNKEKAKRAGYLWICSELMRGYFKLGQVNQCNFILKAITHNMDKEDLNSFTKGLPKAIAVTFYFFWGKYCVFDNNLKEADEKLSWAFKHTPKRSKANRRKILLYLVPCKLRLGVLPTQALLQEHDLGLFIDIVRAIRDGNVQLFTSKMEEYTAEFIKMGTYLLMMKLKFMVLRTLTKGVHKEIRSRDGNVVKIDLAPFEHVFQWQDSCDTDETACLLSNLIYQGAVKGYLSHEHRKIVFAKDVPFPAPSKWKQ
jgi:hypothetical protein